MAGGEGEREAGREGVEGGSRRGGGGRQRGEAEGKGDALRQASISLLSVSYSWCYNVRFA